MASSDPALPPSTSPLLALAHPTENEKIKTWHLNGKSWAGRLSMQAYVRREEHLAQQAFTRNGGITYWILVDSTKLPNQREIFASCESLRKRALIARAERDGSGDVEEVVSHGIGSVFCDPRFRGRGYARRMIEDLANKLDTWQQPDGRKTDFTVLYSDIGKKFYSRVGWQPYTSSHIVLPPVASKNDFFNKSRLLYAGDLQKLCLIDEASVIKKGLVQQSAKAGKTMVSLIPDWQTMQWHHAREEFAAREILDGRVPEVKGAYIQCSDDSRVWCIWSRFFGNENNNGNILNILRMVIEGEEDLSPVESDVMVHGRPAELDDEKVLAVASLLRAAQIEAAKWNMKNVQIWNPTPLAVQGAEKIAPRNAQVTHRDEESIASLRWHHEDSANIEWLGNEKYGWC